MTVESDNEVVATGRQHGRLYCMDFECVKMRSGNATSSALMTGRINKQLELWHQRFGHLGNENLVKLVNKGMVEGMKIANTGKKNEKLLCEPCITAKQTREPFKVRSDAKRASRSLEIVHSDVCGKITPLSWDGNEYFVSFTDDYTHVSVVYLMKTKDQVLECLKEYEAMASAHFGTGRVFQSDDEAVLSQQGYPDGEDCAVYAGAKRRERAAQSYHRRKSESDAAGKRSPKVPVG